MNSIRRGKVSGARGFGNIEKKSIMLSTVTFHQKKPYIKEKGTYILFSDLLFYFQYIGKNEYFVL
jgi:hypothetical protein